MTVFEQYGDGWRPSCPIPLWVGFRLRVAQCECGEKFRGRRAEEKYRAHWYETHAG